MPLEQQLEEVHRKFGVRVVYNDGQIAVVEKPQGLIVRDEERQDTLQHLVRENVGGFENYTPAHRIDRDTTGLVVGALNPSALLYLHILFRNRSLKKAYLAVVDGIMKVGERGKIEASLIQSGERMAVSGNKVSKGLRASTEY